MPLDPSSPTPASADVAALLERAARESARLLGASGAMIYLYHPDSGRLRWAYDAGISDERELAWVRSLEFPPGVGLFGLAIAERRVTFTDDYSADPRFVHQPELDRFVREVNIRSMIAAPMIGPDGPLGAIGAYARGRGAFDEARQALLMALADHAAIAIENARLIERLRASRAELARRALAERILREIAESITASRDPDEIRQRIVDEARRLLAADGAHLALITDGEVHSAVVAGDLDAETRGWLLAKQSVASAGAVRAAVDRRVAFASPDRLAELGPDAGSELEAAERIGVRGLAIAPLRISRAVIGTLSVWAHDVRSFSADELELLQALADEAAIAVDNARLDAEQRASEERYRLLAERSPDLVWILDLDERFAYLNPRLEALTGFRPEEFLGRPNLSIVHPDSYPAIAAWLDGVHAGIAEGSIDPAGEQQLRLSIRHRDGSPVAVEMRSVGIVADGVLRGWQASVRDMRDYERLERELRDSEARHRALTENSPDVVWASDLQDVYTFVSSRIESLTGRPPEHYVGRHLVDVVHPDDRSTVRSQLDAVAADIAAGRIDAAAQRTYRFALEHRDGSPVPVEMRTVGLVVDGVQRGWQAAVRDMRERERMERELRRHAGELAASQERAHLAQELHDSVTQALFSMTLTTRSAEMLIGRNPAAAAEKLAELRELGKDALTEMRSLIFELRPGSLEQDGLAVALRKHAAAVQGRTGLPILVEADDAPRLPIEAAEAVYRVAQEALHNVIKHARARNGRISLGRVEGGVRMTVEDDGAGFDADHRPSGGHLGLAGMRARAERAGAQFTVRSRPGEGTTIEVIVPLAAVERAGGRMT